MPTPIKVADQTSVTVAQVSIIMKASNNRRKFLGVFNSGANGIWLGLGQAAVVGVGIFVPPSGGSFITHDGDNLWQGDVFAISAAGNNVTGVLEGY